MNARHAKHAALVGLLALAAACSRGVGPSGVGCSRGPTIGSMGGSDTAGLGGSTTGGTTGRDGGKGGSAGVTGGGGAGAAGGSGGSGGGSAWKCPDGPFGEPVPKNPQVQKINGVPPLDGFFDGSGILEGPVWIGDGLYLSHFPFGNTPKSRILKWTPAGSVAVFWAEAGTNGLSVDKEGNIVAGRHQDGSITRFTLQDPKNTAVIANIYQGARFNSPNDLALRSDGNIYFSDPDYQAPPTSPQDQTRVYRIAPGGAVSVVDATLDQPNGITLSLDENTLYVANATKVYRYTVGAQGQVSGRVEFSPGGSDGMGMDCAGNLYVTRDKTVVVLNKSGNEIASIGFGVTGSVTNLAFGGPERKTLYVTSLGATQELHQVTLNVPGMPY